MTRQEKIIIPNDLIAVIALTIITVLVIVAPVVNTSILRAVLGFVLVLFLPGYSLTSALFPNNNELGTVERIALSMGLSICVVVFVGLALNYTPWGIRLGPIVVVLSILIIIFTAISAIRRSVLSR